MERSSFSHLVSCNPGKTATKMRRLGRTDPHDLRTSPRPPTSALLSADLLQVHLSCIHSTLHVLCTERELHSHPHENPPLVALRVGGMKGGGKETRMACTIQNWWRRYRNWVERLTRRCLVGEKYKANRTRRLNTKPTRSRSKAPKCLVFYALKLSRAKRVEFCSLFSGYRLQIFRAKMVELISFCNLFIERRHRSSKK